MIKLVWRYQTSDGKLFENESDAKDYENITFEAKYFYHDYENNKLCLKELDVISLIDELEDPVGAILEETSTIFIPSMWVLNSLCKRYPDFMPRYDNTNLVPHPGYYTWVDAEECFIPVEALNRLSNWELEKLDLNRQDINYLMSLEREAGLET